MKTILLSLLLLIMYPGKRQVFIFYNTKGEALKNKQLTELNRNSAGLKERDMTVQAYSTSAAKAEVKLWNIDPSKPFTVILVGKDGGEKLRSDSILSATQFFNTIDAMPMRKNEMNR